MGCSVLDDLCFAAKLCLEHKYGPSMQVATGSPLKRFLEKHKTLRTALLVVVLFGASMVIGDGVLTPAISAVDPFRKPKPGLWHIMEKHFNSGIPIDMDQSFYVGDAAGRPNDHSDADIKFAHIFIENKTSFASVIPKIEHILPNSNTEFHMEFALIKQIKNLIEAAEQDYEKEKLNKGLLNYLVVGAQTETELKERKLRVEDALNATKAAVEEGIVEIFDVQTYFYILE
ncbi:hypothetical protein GOBAR_DD25009 [Gossypium barbadense]|nr:hypothetical protein GOBAR_DD25009 [Gossypium barbadense]